MTDVKNTITKDPSLKRYFKYMLTNRKMSVQFTSRKIREIIESDLGIKLIPAQSLYARVCIEAFAYYMQSWPEWNLAIKSQYSDALYDCLITFLRNKLLLLRQQENSFKVTNSENNTVILQKPSNMHLTLQNGFQKVTAPYTLRVNIPESLWNSRFVALKNYGTNNIYLELCPIQPSEIEFQDNDIVPIIYHPYFYAEFNLPGLITFNRSCPIKIDRYLHTVNDDLIKKDSNHIISVEETDINSPHKVYTYQLMIALQSALNKSMVFFKEFLDYSLRSEILVLFDAFVADIFRSNVKNTTVCEGSRVQYNIAKTLFYIECEFNTTNLKNEKIVFTKVLTPIIAYNLVSCAITQENMQPNETLDYFNFDHQKTIKFIEDLRNSLKYKCTACDLEFSFTELRTHFRTTHPIENNYMCIKCSRCFSISKLLSMKWRHECKPLVPRT